MDMFYALAEPNRRKIIRILARNGQLTSSGISNRFKISPQAVSQHLSVLLNAGFLIMERHAQQRIYRLNPGSMLEMETWLKQTRKIWEDRLDRLDIVLEDEKNRRLNI